VGHTGGLLVVRCEEGTEPVFDERVYNSSLDGVGETVEFFGPVERPYALVENTERVETGSKLYLRD
jgi:rRNA processing protein Gar1